ncbi:hypothetical protein [Acinetobacter radioresistens]|uniref:hypothetical protein n=1 Tax=Acinetobacter radioresistens TaxID=40216 RepID=UPI0009461CE4|nr:hypothetical protein [Acinetobacter radioresistens]
MAGLAGLKKRDQPSNEDKLVENFIAGADKRVKDLEVKQKKFVRCTFSLNEEVSILIDELVVKGQNAKASRSCMVRIALEHFAMKDSEEIKRIVNENFNN